MITGILGVGGVSNRGFAAIQTIVAVARCYAACAYMYICIGTATYTHSPRYRGCQDNSSWSCTSRTIGITSIGPMGYSYGLRRITLLYIIFIIIIIIYM